MQQKLEYILSQLEKYDDLTFNDAALQLGLLLEANAGAESSEDLLSNDLRDIKLSERDEKEIVERVVLLAEDNQHPLRRHILWVLSKASPEVLFVPLVKLIHLQESSFDEESAVQAVFALNKCLGCEDRLFANSALLRDYDLTGFLERMNTPKMSHRTNIVPRDLDKIRRAMNGD